MIKNIEGLIEQVTKEIKERTDVAVIGLSGGADSTLVACLCTLALGKDNVYGIHMPYGDTDKQKFNMKSQLLSKKLGVKGVLIPIVAVCNTLDGIVAPAIQTMDNPNFKYPTYKLNLVNSGNTRSRVRMCILYSICHELGASLKKKVRVIGTGNLSEDWIGYDTKFGDSAADIFPIGQLFKSEVYQLLDHFKSIDMINEDLIDRTPSAGLWEGQKDQDELGYSYDEMEPAIKHLINPNAEPIDVVDGSRFDQILSFVSSRHAANKHKHEAPPTIDLRNFCD